VDSPLPPPPALEYRLAIDLPVTATLATAYLLSSIWQADLAPDACRVCAPGALDDAVRGARWDDADAANTLSNVTGFALTPALAIGWEVWEAQDAREAATDLGLVAEAAVVAASANQLTKLLVGRERPFVHALSPAEKPHTADPSDNNLSFYSGHTTLGFAIASAEGTIASRRGRQRAPYVWASGLTLAAVTGYLRIAADKHYLTDVLAGAAFGTGIGYGVVRLHERAPPLAVLPVVAPGYFGVSARLVL
jgi:membrane-associated phospholipid phosphatase